MTSLYAIEEISGIYVDAAVGNQRKEIVFLSLWGLDTAIQECLAKFSLPWQKGGITHINIVPADAAPNNPTSQWYQIENYNVLQKHTGRISARDSLFEKLVHLWIYHPLIRKIDYANRQCLLLKQQSEDAENFAQRVWEAVKTVCPVPLLDAWKFLVNAFQQQEWIRHYPGIQLDAYHLNFNSPEMEPFISTMIKQGKLTLPEQYKQKSHLALV
jgi:hypothetical protein